MSTLSVAFLDLLEGVDVQWPDEPDIPDEPSWLDMFLAGWGVFHKKCTGFILAAARNLISGLSEPKLRLLF